MLDDRNALSEPFDGGALNAAELAAHSRFQHYDAIVVVNCADAKKTVKDLRGAERRLNNPV
ncbi:hypothetical protein [Novosphingobium jiangmenense]|uniref:Uncharacterized protein n=1 Tax=Novosphingobium jiangmenense TaxID=2791981 RepID=A0ABS0HKH5_9SPHN|nr:hypothetical protein [Novosphingobium jiangmenense]MBF9152755.1 hypothetical protein [Novosphingobium jiangmenense]